MSTAIASTGFIAEDGEALAQRAREFLIASVVSSYPDESFSERLAALEPRPEEEPSLAVLTSFFGAARSDLDEVRSCYLELCDGRRPALSLYETEYGRTPAAKGNSLADLAGFYRAFGMEPTEGAQKEMLDHLGVELEFYAVLLAKEAMLEETGEKEGMEVVQDARRKFLDAHLGRLAPAVARQGEAAALEVYQEVFSYCAALVERECLALGIAVPPLEAPAERERDGQGGMECGAVGGAKAAPLPRTTEA